MRSTLRAVLALSLLLPLLLLQAAPVQADQGDRSTFIITLRDGDPNEVSAEHAHRYDADIEFVYEHALRGYAAQISEARVGELARDRRVERIERDQVVHAVGTQDQPTWGLDRVDQRQNTLDGTYNYATTGSGVTAYIIDTGIRNTHNDFGGRAQHGYDFVDKDFDTTDCNGHGTHVAGTVGGSTWGVAKDVTLVGVRVLDCGGSGTWSGVIAGIDWVTNNAAKPAVANMSLGGGASDSVDDAVRNSIDAGISYAIAAGNGNRGGRQQDACGSSPARVIEAMTVGATNQSDAKTSWSNYGDCVDWFAPGYQIKSAWIDSDSDTNTISGTSMAAPHTAGAAALYLEGATDTSPTAVREYLFKRTTKYVVTSSSTANNHLLSTLADEDPLDGGGDDPPPPDDGGGATATISTSCSKSTCTFDAAPDASTWDFGDGNDGTGDPVEHTFAPEVTATYTVVATGGTDTDPWTASVIVDCAPKGRWVHCAAAA